MKLKTGIIGCGKVGDFHAKAYAQLENSEFTAVCDANLERAKAFAERYNVHAYSDIAEMIQKEHLDVVSVCTPHPIHCDPAVTAAENGCNVLIEKPLASSLADCIENIHIPPQTADFRLFSPQNTGKEPTDCILVCGFLQITPQRSGNSIQAARRRAK